MQTETIFLLKIINKYCKLELIKNHSFWKKKFLFFHGCIYIDCFWYTSAWNCHKNPTEELDCKLSVVYFSSLWIISTQGSPTHHSAGQILINKKAKQTKTKDIPLTDIKTHPRTSRCDPVILYKYLNVIFNSSLL